MNFPPEFLEKMALDRGLSPDQEQVFILRFAYQEDYQIIAEKLNTTKSACLKRMGQVYKKFEFNEGGRGKENRLKSQLLEEYQQWKETQKQQPTSLASLSISPLSSNNGDLPRLESPDSPVSLDSPFYVKRLPQEEFYYQEILQPGSLINIKSPQKTGKTSLMNRILQQAKKEDYHIVNFNLTLVNETVLSQLETFLKWFWITITKKLNLENKLADIQDSDFDCVECEFAMEDLLESLDKPLVLALDNIERLFNYPEIAIDFCCSLLRVFHENGKQNSTWEKLRLVIAYSTKDIPKFIHSSPLNMGSVVELPDFTDKQIQNLAQLHGLNWDDTKIKKLMAMLGGNPYLIRLALYKIARQEITFDELLKTAPTEAGIYRFLLQQHLTILNADPDLYKCFKQIVDSERDIDIDSSGKIKLHSMGLIKLIGNNVAVSCGLYRDYFREHLREVE